jgi:hypothetical protein
VADTLPFQIGLLLPSRTCDLEKSVVELYCVVSHHYSLRPYIRHGRRRVKFSVNTRVHRSVWACACHVASYQQCWRHNSCQLLVLFPMAELKTARARECSILQVSRSWLHCSTVKWHPL